MDKCHNCCCYKCANKYICNVSFLDKQSIPRCEYCKNSEKDIWYENCRDFEEEEG